MRSFSCGQLGPIGRRGVGAGAAMVFAAVVAAVPVHGQIPSACAAADATLREQVQTLLHSSDPRAAWLLSNTIAAVKTARGLCSGNLPERGLLVYKRATEALNTLSADQVEYLASGQSPPPG